MNANPHIFLANADNRFREMLRLMMQWARPTFQLAEAYNGQEAYTYYHQHGADLILTDDRTPMMSGTLLIQTLRAEAHCVPIVLLSSLQTTRIAVADDEYTVFAAKPVLFPDLLLVIDLLLAG